MERVVGAFYKRMVGKRTDRVFGVLDNAAHGLRDNRKLLLHKPVELFGIYSVHLRTDDKTSAHDKNAYGKHYRKNHLCPYRRKKAYPALFRIIYLDCCHKTAASASL